MNISFKGYDAVPLKALHISQSWDKIGDEFKQICDKENIELKQSKFNGSFNQDTMLFTEKNGKQIAIVEEAIDVIEPFREELENELGMDVEFVDIFDRSTGFMSGGNFFLGKKPDGTKFMLVGNTEYLMSSTSKVAERFGVAPENIHYIQQQDYHLDMSLRPIGYPYVLINNPKMAAKNELKVKGINPNSNHKIEVEESKMFSYKKGVEQLQEAGFVPIPIGAVYFANGASINFMNAIVNKHDDGSISYITNSSKCNDYYVSKYEKMFNKQLQQKLKELSKTDKNVPQLSAPVYFIQGENYGNYNEVMMNLFEGSGGVHCMASEEPNFEKWV